MLQYKMLFFVISIIVVIFFAFSVAAFWRRHRSNQNSGFSVDEIKAKYFPELESEKFSKVWPEFCRVVGTRNAYVYLNNKAPVFERFFPISDLFYENLEEFLTHDDGDVSELTGKQIFYLFYERQSSG